MQAADPRSAALNLSRVFRIRGLVDVAKLLRAGDSLVSRHGSLRTRFVQVQGNLLQQVADPSEAVPSCAVYFGTVLGTGELSAAISSAIASPFALESVEPLLRLNVFNAGPAEFVVVISVHHIACDGESLSMLLAELGAIYEDAPLHDLLLDYGSYALWERELLSVSYSGELAAHWSAYLDGATHTLELPTRGARTPETFTEAGIHRFAVPGPLQTRLEGLSRDVGGTLAASLLAAFSVLLAKLSGTDDLLVGIPVPCRPVPEMDDVVGMFVNTLPFRACIPATTTLAEAISFAADGLAQMLDHSELPFQSLVERINPARVSGQNPLFQAMFQLVGPEMAVPLRLAGSLLDEEPAVQLNSFFDLCLDVAYTPEGLSCLFNYDKALFSAGDIDAWSVWYLSLLEMSVQDPGRRLSEVALGPSGAVPAITHGPTVHVPPDVTIVSALHARAEVTPGLLALRDAETAWTFEELSHGVLRRATAVVARAAPRTPVALLMDRSGESILWMLAILHAGCVLVALDPGDPLEHTRLLLKEAGVKLVVGSVQSVSSEVPVLATCFEEVSTEHRDEGRPPAPGNDAYVTFTSGSTGAPKGVLIKHSALVNLLGSHQAGHFRRIAEASGVSQLIVAHTLSVAFDASWDPVLWMLAGHQMLIADEETRKDASRLWKLIVAGGVNVLETTPSHLESLFEFAGGDRLPSSVVGIVLGGEPIGEALWYRLAAIQSLIVINMYGPTEFTVDALWTEVSSLSPPRVGWPVANCRAYVADVHGALAPPGVPGELCLSGPQLACGYINSAEQTAKRFVPNPFDGRVSSRMYKTGDQVRLDADSGFVFLGRSDGQVKVRGHRVELGAVEAAYRLVPGVTDAAVVARADPSGGLALVGYVTTESGLADGAKLTRAVTQSLPQYMRPTSTVVLDAIPRGASGKVRTSQLPLEVPNTVQAGLKLSGSVQHALAEIYEEVLDVKPVWADSDFFALGGHSLTAVKLIARVFRKFGSELTLRDVFDRPAVQDLASLITPVKVAALPARSTELTQGTVSHAQERLWFLQGLAPGSPAYNMVEGLNLTGPLDVNLLTQAFDLLVEHHLVLRSHYSFDGQALTQVMDRRPPRLVVLDWTQYSTSVRGRMLSDAIDNAINMSYDLSTGPVFRPSLIQLSANRSVMLLAMHHIVADARTIRIILRDISVAYHALATSGQAGAISAQQYSTYAQWERQNAASSAGKEHERFWREQLTSIPSSISFPSGGERPEIPVGRGSSVNFVVPRIVVERLTAVARAERTTLFVCLLAAVRAALSRWSGQRAFCIGVPVAGRTRAEFEDIVGFFVNMVPVRGANEGDVLAPRHVAAERAEVLAAFAHQDLPFERIVEAVNPPRKLNVNPLFQVSCQLLGDSGESDLDLANVHASPIAIGVVSSRLDLQVDFVHTGHVVAAEVCFSTELLTQPAVTDFVSLLLATLHELAGSTLSAGELAT